MTPRSWAGLAGVVALLVLLTATTGWWGLVVVLGLVVMIFLHELGHYIMAKRAGMKVTEFFLGFGPRIWSFRRGETEYGLKLIPALAYVKIVGMNNLDEVAPEDEGRSYRQQPFWQRFGVAVAGSTMHFLQAFALIFVVLVAFAIPGGSLFSAPSRPGYWVVTDVSAHSAAAAAGLQPGDHVQAIDGHRFRKDSGFQSYVASRPNEPVTLTVERDGRQLTLPATIGVAGSTDRGLLGISGGLDYASERVGVLHAVPQTFREFGTAMVGSVEGIGRVFSPSSLSNFGHQLANANDSDQASQGSPTVAPSNQHGAQAASSSSSSSANDNRFISIVGVFQIGTASVHNGVWTLLMLFALINIFIGVFNLMPLLPFDGGHVVVAVYEKAQEWRLHLRQRYFADVMKLMPLTYLVVLLLAGIFVTTLYLDIAKPITSN
jgi:membrane-associated protease RseP (regulator of RpoE activity)